MLKAQTNTLSISLAATISTCDYFATHKVPFTNDTKQLDSDVLVLRLKERQQSQFAMLSKTHLTSMSSSLNNHIQNSKREKGQNTVGF